MGLIYKATFPNGKSYIGQTSKTLSIRKTQHKSDCKKDTQNLPFYNAIKKYGWNNIFWEILEEGNGKEFLNEREQYWIKYYRTYIKFKDSKGYNATLGGGSREEFTVLNEEQLKQFGLDYKNGMSKKELQKKYNIKDYICNAIVCGRQWSDYTGIPLRDKNIPRYSVLRKEEVDKIIERFKEIGNISQLSREYDNCSRTTIHSIILGETWSEYTGIIDNSFFEQYKRIGGISNSDVLKMRELFSIGLKSKEIQQQYFPSISCSKIQKIVQRKTRNNIN